MIHQLDQVLIQHQTPQHHNQQTLNHPALLILLQKIRAGRIDQDRSWSYTTLETSPNQNYLMTLVIYGMLIYSLERNRSLTDPIELATSCDPTRIIREVFLTEKPNDGDFLLHMAF